MPGFEHRQKENPNLLGLVFFPEDLEAGQFSGLWNDDNSPGIPAEFGFPSQDKLIKLPEADNLFLLLHSPCALCMSCALPQSFSHAFWCVLQHLIVWLVSLMRGPSEVEARMLFIFLTKPETSKISLIIFFNKLCVHLWGEWSLLLKILAAENSARKLSYVLTTGPFGDCFESCGDVP